MSAPADLQDRISDLFLRDGDVSWGVSVRHLGEPVVDIDGQAVFPSASMGKVFILLAVARLLSTSGADSSATYLPQASDLVGDSGLWQHMVDQPLSMEALCVLTAGVSDNIAANVLLREIGLESAQQLSTELGVPHTRIVDRIRDVRTTADPEVPSQSRASDLAILMERIADGTAIGPATARVRRWLSLNTDLSMVASGFDLDPLAHASAPPAMWLFNKTGTDAGVRADAGCFGAGDETWSYAVVARWAPEDQEAVHRVMGAMRGVGHMLRATAGL